MHKLFSTAAALGLGLAAPSGVFAQDVSINTIAQENSVNDGVWPQDAPEGTTTILVSICNNDGGNTNLPAYKLRPLRATFTAVSN